MLRSVSYLQGEGHFLYCFYWLHTVTPYPDLGSARPSIPASTLAPAPQLSPSHSLIYSFTHLLIHSTTPTLALETLNTRKRAIMYNARLGKRTLTQRQLSEFLPEPSRKAKYLICSIHRLSLLREQTRGIAFVPSQPQRSLCIQIDVLHNIVRREPSPELALALALARWEIRRRYP